MQWHIQDLADPPLIGNIYLVRTFLHFIPGSARPMRRPTIRILESVRRRCLDDIIATDWTRILHSKYYRCWRIGGLFCLCAREGLPDAVPVLFVLGWGWLFCDSCYLGDWL